MTEKRTGYRLTPRLERHADEWTAATVHGARLDLVAQFAVEWLALEAQERALVQARYRLCHEAEAAGMPVPTILTALRHLADVQRLETPTDVLLAVMLVLRPLVEEEP